MYREQSLNEICDGRMYTENDMVRTDTGNCAGCRQVCCKGMERSIVLDPYDVHRLTQSLNTTFDQLLKGPVEINIVDGIMLPNLAMNKDTDACSFLDSSNKCTIHDARPGVCRLFPLGRYWEDDTHYKYIFQKDQCHKENLSKIKVKKWINNPADPGYDQFIKDWHRYIVRIRKAVYDIQSEGYDDKIHADDIGADSSDIQNKKETQIRTICMYTLKTFYLTPFIDDKDFFGQIGHRISDALHVMGMD